MDRTPAPPLAALQTPPGVDPDDHYARARERLALSEPEDAAATAKLASILARRDEGVYDPHDLQGTFGGAIATVLGPLERGAATLAERPPTGPLVVAGSAVGPALAWRLAPALIVTDLDGPASAHVTYSEQGVPTAVHAHGDNVELLDTLLPHLTGPVFGTCQTAPPPAADGPSATLHRVGGFTDGDRACFLACALGADAVELVGFDWTSPVGEAALPGRTDTAAAHARRKETKLALARELLDDLPVPVLPRHD